ncbi:unnamed protein product [Paramecium primaurelia]|uniref:Uncharacterized protein n=1 Tax=Paramecium primaurelia TaxID=5886 RepID=A0A8S1Q175_PARPR|nr:unnamed protein product [Paramecium primaurelia]
MNQDKMTEEKEKKKTKRFDKRNQPILKGVSAKAVTFRDQIEGIPIQDVYIVERIQYQEQKNKCSCSCAIQ